VFFKLRIFSAREKEKNVLAWQLMSQPVATKTFSFSSAHRVAAFLAAIGRVCCSRPGWPLPQWKG